MMLIKEGIARTIPAHLAAEYKAQGWREILPDEAKTEAENATEPDAPEAEKPKRGRSKKGA